MVPCDLVIDHSVQVDHYGFERAYQLNVDLEMERNRERYQLLKFAQRAFRNFRVVPPGTGIVHQVNLEYLAPLVQLRQQYGELTAYPDTVVGTDSHTTMINGLGVLGWGVGGIEAEAVMLGQPYFMLVPDVIGMKLTGELPLGTTATDLVLTVTQMLRKKGVVDKFVEFYGPGLSSLGLADRATIANMAPEYGATMGFFPVDAETIRYLERTGRDPRAGAPGGVVLQGAGALPHRPDPRSGVHRHARARPVQGGAEPRGAPPAAGSGAAARAQAELHRESARPAERQRLAGAARAGGEYLLALGGRGRRQRHHRRARCGCGRAGAAGCAAGGARGARRPGGLPA